MAQLSNANADLVKMAEELLQAESRVAELRFKIESNLVDSLMQSGDTSFFKVDWTSLKRLTLKRR